MPSGLVGDEGHHVEHSEAGVGAAVRPEVESFHSGCGESPGTRDDGVGGPGEGEHGTVVVLVAVQVEQGRPGGCGQLVEHRLVAALAEVDHALEDRWHSELTPGRYPAGGGVLLGGDGV